MLTYKDLQIKYAEVYSESANKMKKEVILEKLAERGVIIEGDKFGYVNEKVEINENNEKDSDMVFLSISARIRYLFDNGTKQSVIAKELKVRDQFVSNVVRKYKESKKESALEITVDEE